MIFLNLQSESLIVNDNAIIVIEMYKLAHDFGNDWTLGIMMYHQPEER